MSPTTAPSIASDDESPWVDRLDRGFYWLLAVPFIVSWGLLWAGAVNIPHADDYDVFLRSMNRPQVERWRDLLGFHNEHRLAVPRLVAEAQLMLTGRVSFRGLAAIGHLGLSSLLLPLWWIFRRRNLSRIFFLPVPYLLLLGPYWENMIWATGGLQNHLVLPLSVTSLWLFSRPGLCPRSMAYLVAGLAVITSGHGLFVWPVLAVWDLVEWLQGRRRAIGWWVTSLCTALVFGAYFQGYSRPAYHPGLSDVLADLPRAAGYFLAFLGSYLRPMALAMAAGTITLLLWICLTLARLSRPTPACYIGLYVVLNGLAATVSRSPFGISQALSSRYTTVSMLLLIVVYLMLPTGSLRPASEDRPLFRHRHLPALWLTLAILFGAAASAFNAKMIFQHRADLVAGMRLKADGTRALDAPGTHDHFHWILAESERQGIYCPPASTSP